jgi:hypothetical protein
MDSRHWSWSKACLCKIFGVLHALHGFQALVLVESMPGRGGWWVVGGGGGEKKKDDIQSQIFGFSDFQTCRFSISFFSFLKLFSENMLVRYRRMNNNGVLERPGTKLMVSKAISTTLKFQYFRKVDFLMSCKTKSRENLCLCLRTVRAVTLDTPRPPQFDLVKKHVFVKKLIFQFFAVFLPYMTRFWPYMTRFLALWDPFFGPGLPTQGRTYLSFGFQLIACSGLAGGFWWVQAQHRGVLTCPLASS